MDEIKRMIVERHIEKFPLGTADYMDVIRDYMNAIQCKTKRCTEQVISTLNNTWREMNGCKKTAVYGNRALKSRN